MKSTFLILCSVVVLSGLALAIWSAMTIPTVEVGDLTRTLVRVVDYKGNEMPKEYPTGRYSMVIVAEPK